MDLSNFCKWLLFGIYHGMVAFFGFLHFCEKTSPPSLTVSLIQCIKLHQLPLINCFFNSKLGSPFSFGATIYHSVVHIVNLRVKYIRALGNQIIYYQQIFNFYVSVTYFISKLVFGLHYSYIFIYFKCILFWLHFFYNQMVS